MPDCCRRIDIGPNTSWKLSERTEDQMRCACEGTGQRLLRLDPLAECGWVAVLAGVVCPGQAGHDTVVLFSVLR